MAEKERNVPPYVPWPTFEGYVDRLQAFGNTLPNVIDRDSMRNYSGAMQSWLLTALKYLQLIDSNGIPQPNLAALVRSDEGARKALYRKMIPTAYPFLDGINLQGATPKQIEMAFESTGASGDTVRKCMSFFVSLAKAADLPLSPLLIKVRRKGGSNGATRAKRAKREVVPNTPPVIQTLEQQDQMPQGFERMPIPGMANAYIQYPSSLTDANCDVIDAMVGALRAYAKSRAGKGQTK